MKKSKLLLYSAISGIILSLAWLPFLPGWFVFVGFLPLLYVENFIWENQQQYRSITVFQYSYLTFGIWNLISFWWVYKAAWIGLPSVIIINGFFQAIVFWLFHITKRQFGARKGNIAFVVYWLGFEYLHTNWDISFPCLSLGNAFAKDIEFIQWYEYTGVMGGSLWVLLISLLLFDLRYLLPSFGNSKTVATPQYNGKVFYIKITTLFLLITIPIIMSLIIYKNYEEKSNEREIAIIQPNIDPHTEKFDGSTADQQLTKIINLAESVADSTVDYFVGPETAIVEGLWIEGSMLFEPLNPMKLPTHQNWYKYLKKSTSINRIQNFIAKYPNSKFVIGSYSHQRCKLNDEVSATAHKIPGTNIDYDGYNSALLIDTTDNLQIYHKSQLFLGVEKMPYPKLLGFLNTLMVNLGGTSGFMSTQKERSVFAPKNDSIKIATLICWESLYGEYIAEFVRNGANTIFVITNDGWWGDTPGHKFHLSMSQVRAIETRRSIVRSANTGTSCFINQRGELLQPTDYGVAKAIRGQINLNNKLTFYVIFGDYIGRLASFLAVLFLIYVFVRKKMNMKRS